MKKFLAIAVLSALALQSYSEEWRSKFLTSGTNPVMSVTLDDSFNPPCVLDSFSITPTFTNLFTNQVAFRYVYAGLTNYPTIWQDTITNTVARTNGGVFIKNFDFVMDGSSGLSISNSWTNANQTFNYRLNWRR